MCIVYATEESVTYTEHPQSYIDLNMNNIHVYCICHSKKCEKIESRTMD